MLKMKNSLFNIVNLNQKYSNSFFGLKNISMYISEGEIVGLIGKNGSGKTTLLDTLSNLEHKISGNFYYEGKSVDNNFYKNILGYLPTTLNLYDYLTLRENLEFIFELRKRKYDEKWIDNMLTDFELYSSLDTPLVDLSRGMRIKFNFIITLIHNPQILLLDEPFEGLDPAQAITLKNTLKNQANTGKGILLSSHILSYLSDICNRIYFIKNGEIVKEVVNTNELSLSSLEALFYE